MAIALKGKRNYEHLEKQQVFIDLTESDEERPTKRPKSNSGSLTPVPEGIEDDHFLKPRENPATNIQVKSHAKPVQNTNHTNGHLQDFVLPEVQPLRFETNHSSAPAIRTHRSPSKDALSSQNRNERQPSLVHLPKPTTTILESNVAPSSKTLQKHHTHVHARTSVQLTSAPRSEIRIDIPSLPLKQSSIEQERLRELKRKKAIARLKQSANYAKENITEVEDLFGTTGFSTVYTSDPPNHTFTKGAQRKKKTVIRDQLVLGLESLKIDQADTLTTQLKDNLYHPRRQARYVLRRRFGKGHAARLSFENRLNDRQLDGKFQFVDSYILTSRVMKKKLSPYPARACECSNQVCDRNCECFRQKIGDQEKVNIQVQTYHRRADGLVVLSDEFLNSNHDSIVIRECGPSCSCSTDCINRVTQKGRTIPLEIFMTQKCGFGVRAKQHVHRGQFLDFYLGEVVTEAELSKREDAVDEDTPSYVMSLDCFTETTSSSTLYVDGSNFGSVTRFFNHSCRPNCKTFNVVLEGDSKSLYHIAFFATEDIRKGTELTIDYDPHLTLMVDEGDVAELEDDVVRCECDQPNCRKRLWPKGKEKRRRKKRHQSESD